MDWYCFSSFSYFTKWEIIFYLSKASITLKLNCDAYIFQVNIVSSLLSYIRNLICIIRTLKSLITCCSIICWGRRTNIARAFYEYICILDTHAMFLARLYPLITKGSRRLVQLHRFKVHEKYQVFILWFLGMTK